MDASSAPPGGFIRNPLPSPSPSNASSIITHHPLPRPRASGPLKPGSQPETAFISFLDDQLLQVSRKHAKKFNDGGYADIKAVVQDLERLVDVIWYSSTPTLQTHYLLQIANSFNDYLASFPPRLKQTIQLLDKLDRCFYALVTGNPVDNLPLSPAAVVYRMGMTEKVRLKSVIERTRLHVAKLADGGMAVPPDLPTSSVKDVGGRGGGMDVEGEGKEQEVEEEEEEEGEEEWEIEVAKVYDGTLTEVGESLKRDGNVEDRIG